MTKTFKRGWAAMARMRRALNGRKVSYLLVYDHDLWTTMTLGVLSMTMQMVKHT